MILQYLQLIQPAVYEGNKSRGFWEKGLDENKGERVMLIITELAEAVEAHRKNNLYALNVHQRNIVDYLNGSTVSDNPGLSWEAIFKRNVKDTVEDEIADAVIRILDYTGGFNIELRDSEYRRESTGNFAYDVLKLTNLCHSAFLTDTCGQSVGKDWSYVIAAIIKFCEWYNIDLMQHVQWKLKYNATREHKHGKKY